MSKFNSFKHCNILPYTHMGLTARISNIFNVNNKDTDKKSAQSQSLVSVPLSWLVEQYIDLTCDWRIYKIPRL